MSTGATSKESRRKCHQARDTFYACVQQQGLEFAPGVAVPPSCSALRKQFQASCPASWVHHFDEQQEASARRAKYLATVINQQAETARGSLSGKR